jgi:hypothetical protein
VIRIRILSAVGLALAGLALALAACGGSGSVGDDGSPSAGDGGTTASTTTYTNDQYGYAITYSDTLEQGEPAEGSGAGGGSVLDVAFADRSGPVVAGRYVNAVQVSVYELAREVDPAEVPDLEGELQSVVDEIMASLPNSEVVEPLTGTEVSGVPGFALKYTYAVEGTEITAVTAFLLNGAYEYQITAQAASADWEKMKDDLEATVNSFTVQ